MWPLFRGAVLPDIVSSLGTQEGLSADGFREILGFLITFIQKDRQTESMVEKLCVRFDTSDAVRHHRQVAFCLGSLSHTDKSVKKLIELYRTYGNKLGDDEVLGSFQALVAKARKGFGVKAETKATPVAVVAERVLGARGGEWCVGCVNPLQKRGAVSTKMGNL